MADELRRAKLKTAHALRSQFNYEIGLERIDYRLDVIDPAIKQVALEATKGKLPEFPVEDKNANSTNLS